MDDNVQLQYFKWEPRFTSEVKPYYALFDLPEGFPRANFEMANGPHQKIQDMRRDITSFSLDSNAFVVRNHVMPVSTFDESTIEEIYLPSMRRLIEEELGPNVEVHMFDWRLRSSDDSKRPEPGEVVDLDDRSKMLRPLTAVHVDQSLFAARRRVVRHMGDRADELIKGRVRIINVWRPLKHAVDDFPLAVCDGSTVPESDLIAVDNVRKSYISESLYPLFSSGLRWYYLHRQEPNEVLMLKMFDSAQHVDAHCCPHATFKQTRTVDNPKPRESIEARALVFSKE